MTTFQSHTPGTRSPANPANALFAFEDGIVANADRTQLQHLAGFSCRPGNNSAAPAEYVG
jgi:hypothetical protein